MSFVLCFFQTILDPFSKVSAPKKISGRLEKLEYADWLGDCVIFILQELDDITKAAGNSHEYFIEGLSEGKTLEEAKEYLRGTVYILGQ